MKWLIVLIPCLCFAQTQELHVSAYVPPRQCDIKEPCESISEAVKPYVVDSATITEDTVKYVGTKPTVTIKDNIKTVLF